jgi:RNA polymerase-associated protein RTF1
MDMETSEEEEEDGQISKLEEEEEKDRKMFSKTNPDEEPITIEDLEKCRLSRDMLAKFCMAPWFEDYVKGMPSSA